MTRRHQRFVYFIRSRRMRMVKIGSARDPHERLTKLQVGSADKLTLAAMIQCVDADRMERHFHQRFASARARGEWFGVYVFDKPAR